MDNTEQRLHILVDYDNVDPLFRKNGVDYVLHRVFDTASDALAGRFPRRVTIRLYGGWYDGRDMTKTAQMIVRSGYFHSPIVRQPTGAPPGVQVVLEAELARTLISRSGNRNVEPLPYTFRRPCIKPASFRTRFSGHSRCASERCFVSDLDVFFRTGFCPYSEDRRDICECVVRDEQKLVDVMLATDLLYLAHARAEPNVVLVTSDQDLWPAIIEAASQFATLVHVHTKADGKSVSYERMVDAEHYCKTRLV